MKAVIKTKNDFVNIPADSMTENNGMIYVYNDNELVGVFDGGEIIMAYLSEKKGERNDN